MFDWVVWSVLFLVGGGLVIDWEEVYVLVAIGEEDGVY